MSLTRASDLILPSIEELVAYDAASNDASHDEDWDRETRVTTASVRRIPTADAIVRGSVRPPSAPVVVYEPHPTPIPGAPSELPPMPVITRLMPPPFPRSIAQTVLTRRTARAMRWPVFLCGFVAGIFGGMALLKSPIGHQPGVMRAMSAVHRVVP